MKEKNRKRSRVTEIEGTMMKMMRKFNINNKEDKAVRARPRRLSGDNRLEDAECYTSAVNDPAVTRLECDWEGFTGTIPPSLGNATHLTAGRRA